MTKVVFGGELLEEKSTLEGRSAGPTAGFLGMKPTLLRSWAFFKGFSSWTLGYLG